MKPSGFNNTFLSSGLIIFGICFDGTFIPKFIDKNIQSIKKNDKCLEISLKQHFFFSRFRNLYTDADNLTYDMTMGGKTNSLTPVYKWPKEIWRNDGALNLIKGQMIPWCWLTDLKMSTMKGLEYTRHVFFTLEEKYICSVENILKSMRTILMENIDMPQPYLPIQFQKIQGNVRYSSNLQLLLFFIRDRF